MTSTWPGGARNLNIPVVFLVFFLAVSSPPNAYAATEPLYVNVYVDTSVDDARVLVNIRGRVSRLNQSAVALASVSIQVDDPNGSSMHVALVHSDSSGEYSDQFQLPSGRPAGNYTIYVTASKPGFQDAYAKLTFSVGTSPFSINISPSSVTVTQGETATFRIRLESKRQSFSPVHIEVVGLPAHVSYFVAPDNQTVPSVITLSLETSKESDPGSHLLTIIGTSREGESRANAEIFISEAMTPGQYTWVAPPLAAVVLAILLYRRRMVRKKARTSEPRIPEHLQGLALSPSTLLSLPDHLRKTAIIVCQLGEANASEIAVRSGRARAAESDYLNQLVRMGLLKKKRRGRESYFSVESSSDVPR